MKRIHFSLALITVTACANANAYDFAHLVAKSVLQQATGGTHRSSHTKVTPDVALPHTTGNFGQCQQYFANGTPPNVKVASGTLRALCFNGFAVLHSSQTKTPVFSAEVLNRQSLAAARDESRTDVFFEDARLPSAERATLDDYRGSTFDRGHMSPAGDRDNDQSMAQSFALSNMVPQAPVLNRKVWASNVEKATRNYVNRADGNVYVITGPYYDHKHCPIVQAAQVALGFPQNPSVPPASPSEVLHAAIQKGFKAPHRYNAEACTIGNGVAVPSHVYKLVYDPSTKRAWAFWMENTDWARTTKPISYNELVSRTGIEFLPGIQPRS